MLDLGSRAAGSRWLVILVRRACNAGSRVRTCCCSLGLLLAIGCGHTAQPADHAPGAKHEQTRYGIRDLGALDGEGSFAMNVGDAGQVVGVVLPRNGGNRAFICDETGMRVLGTLGGPRSAAYGIRGGTEVVGWATTKGDVTTRPVLWDGKGISELPTPGSSWGMAFRVNRTGTVVGIVGPGSRPERTIPVVWHLHRETRLSAPGFEYGQAAALNDAGVVVGWVYVHGGKTCHACSWERGKLRDLGTLGGQGSQAHAIDAAGDIVGFADIPGSKTDHPVLWSGGRIRDLGTLGGPQGWALAINDLGQVVGWSSMRAGKETRAFIWAAGAMTDLNSLIDKGAGWTLYWASGINNHGQIAGWGKVRGQTHAFLMTPVK